jgi:hypothetical protein
MRITVMDGYLWLMLKRHKNNTPFLYEPNSAWAIEPFQ